MNASGPSNVVTPSAAAAQSRLTGLSDEVADLLRRVTRHIGSGRPHDADAELSRAERIAPRHVEVRRLRAVLLSQQRRFDDARALLAPLANEHPEDVAVLNDLAGAQFGSGDIEGAFATWQRSCDIRPDFATGWINLARTLKHQAWVEESIPAFERGLSLAPDYLLARTLYGDALVHVGELELARAQFLDVLRREPANGAAWWGLAGIKTVPLDDAEVRQAEAMLAARGTPADDAIAIGYALAKAYEDHGRYADAFRTLSTATASLFRRRPWQSDRFHATVDEIVGMFTRPHARADDPRLGEEIVFLVSLPRSGSTLTEQILAAHPDVEGAGELPDLSAVLREESDRRRIEFPRWVAQASAQDWARLGRNYLARTARWRRQRPRATDKMLKNWLFVGAIRAMLPGARIVNCRRDPLETCWSCHKQMLAPGNEFSCDLAAMADFWHEYDRTIRRWQAQAPGTIRDQVYEHLLADPENEIRALLDFCGLRFDAACLRFHEVKRSVRTASAAQVREPLRRNTARTERYGALLDPLRRALTERPFNDGIRSGTA